MCVNNFFKAILLHFIKLFISFFLSEVLFLPSEVLLVLHVQMNKINLKNVGCKNM